MISSFRRIFNKDSEMTWAHTIRALFSTLTHHSGYLHGQLSQNFSFHRYKEGFCLWVWWVKKMEKHGKPKTPRFAKRKHVAKTFGSDAKVRGGMTFSSIDKANGGDSAEDVQPFARHSSRAIPMHRMIGCWEGNLWQRVADLLIFLGTSQRTLETSACCS